MLKLNNVSYRKGKKTTELVRNVTMEVRDADYIAISGQNDAERHALLEILGAVIAPQMGEVYIDGIEYSHHTPNQLTILRRSSFGYFLFDSELNEALTVGENVELPLVFAGLTPEDTKNKLDRALNIVGLGGFKDLKVNKLTEWQRNKALLARAIASEPKVLILSEPCRVQDEARLNEVLGLLSALNRDGVCIIVDSNNAEYFVKAKRRIEISGGAIVELKKERAPRETTKKTKTKKSTKLKSSKIEDNLKPKKMVEPEQQVEEKAVKIEEDKKEVKVKVQKPKSKVALAKTEENSVKADEVEKPKTKSATTSKKKVATETKKTEANNKEVGKKTEEKPKKTQTKTKKADEVKAEEPKKVVRPKKAVEDKNVDNVKSSTRKKKGVEADATSKN